MISKGRRHGATREQIRRLVDDVPHIAEASAERRADIERRYQRALHAAYVHGGAAWRNRRNEHGSD